MGGAIEFAISYAGEDEAVAGQLSERLRELGFSTFFAGEQRQLLGGVDGEAFFARLFTDAKVVVALISKAYHRKPWTQFEWDVICRRPDSAPSLPVVLDGSALPNGMSDTVLYQTLGTSLDPIIAACLVRLRGVEQLAGTKRPTPYERILQSIRDDSKGALAEAFQLVMDQRSRDPLADIDVPSSGSSNPSYRIVSYEWHDFSVVRRLSVRVLVPAGLAPDQLTWNMKHCCATVFNAFKPDAASVLAYIDSGGSPDVAGAFTAGMIEFAPFGEWGKAQDGVAYNIPTTEFDYRVEFNESYFA